MTAPTQTGVTRTQSFARTYSPAKMNGDFQSRHVITVEQFAHNDLEALFADTLDLRRRVRAGDSALLQVCAGKVMATLFYEASTRTDMSFQTAMRRLGGEVIATSGGVQFSSVYKGENLADTIRAVGCYADVIVLRHPESGSTYEAAYYLDLLAPQLERKPVIISGGDGIGEHPTQALLDLFTIRDAKGHLDGLRIMMVGDLMHGRTVHSLAKLLALYEAHDVSLIFVSPPSLRMPAYILDFLRERGISVHETDQLNDALSEADVIYWTRVQEERFASTTDYQAIAGDFIMTPSVLNRAKHDTILMHPLPRKHEMGTQEDHDILDRDPRSVYFRQMENGMFVRMALLARILAQQGQSE